MEPTAGCRECAREVGHGDLASGAGLCDRHLGDTVEELRATCRSMSLDVDTLMAANIEAAEALKNVRGWSAMDVAAIAAVVAKLEATAAAVGDPDAEVH